jgi:hypothetical protein
LLHGILECVARRGIPRASLRFRAGPATHGNLVGTDLSVRTRRNVAEAAPRRAAPHGSDVAATSQRVVDVAHRCVLASRAHSGDFVLPGKIKKLIDELVELRCGKQVALAHFVKAHLVLKGIDPDAYHDHSPDDADKVATLERMIRDFDAGKAR